MVMAAMVDNRLLVVNIGHEGGNGQVEWQLMVVVVVVVVKYLFFIFLFLQNSFVKSQFVIDTI